jgi:hypothetical protein
VTADLPLLEAVHGGLFWRDLQGRWRHNTREVTVEELDTLPRIAVCKPGRTARLTDEGWGQLHPELAQ